MEQERNKRRRINRKEQNFIKAARAMFKTCVHTTDRYGENKKVSEAVKVFLNAMNLYDVRIYTEKRIVHYKSSVLTAITYLEESFVDVIYEDSISNTHLLARRISIKE